MAAAGEHEIRVISGPKGAGPALGAAEVLLRGEFDIATESELAEALIRVACTASRVHVDLTRVCFLDAATVRILVAGCARVREIGGSFSVTCGGGLPRRVIEALGVYDYLEADGVPYPFDAIPPLSA